MYAFIWNGSRPGEPCLFTGPNTGCDGPESICIARPGGWRDQPEEEEEGGGNKPDGQLHVIFMKLYQI